MSSELLKTLIFKSKIKPGFWNSGMKSYMVKVLSNLFYEFALGIAEIIKNISAKNIKI